MCTCLRWLGMATLGVVVTAIPRGAAAGEVTIVVSDPDGAAARVGAPVEIETPTEGGRLQGPVDPFSCHVELVELGQTEPSRALPVPAQDVWGTWRFLMPPGPPGNRKFLLRVSPGRPLPVMNVPWGPDDEAIVTEGKAQVLRYKHRRTAPPSGIDPKYAREDYIHPLYGPNGEVLTDDFPKDHPHHRGVWWSWPVTRWKNEVRDIWAVDGVWSRVEKLALSNDAPILAEIAAQNVWKWSDKEPVVQEVVLIRAFKQGPCGRFIDIQIRLTALEDGVAIGGRPKGGYGGFALRAAPAKEQLIVRHTDPPDAKPRRCWLDYSGRFSGGKDIAGVAILEHPSNPRYPNELQEYPSINCVMSAFPGDREVPLPKDKTLTLKYRLWVHPGRADEKALGDVWSAYANPPKATLTK